MTTPIFMPTLDNDLSLAELGRFDIVIDIINKYTTNGRPEKDLFVIVPDHLDSVFSSVIESGQLSDFTSQLFLRLVVADINVVTIPGCLPEPKDNRSMHRLSSLFSYFMEVINDKPLLEKRGHVSTLTLFLSQIVVDVGLIEKMNVLNHIYETLSHIPELSFIHLYNAPVTVPVSLDIGMLLLRSLTKGYELPHLDLAVTLHYQGEAFLNNHEIFSHLLEPDNEDFMVAHVETVIMPHPVLDEDKEKWLEQLVSRGALIFTDIVSEIVGGSFESERVAKFVLRRLADIIAQVLNKDCPHVCCYGHQDIYPWLIQYRQRLISHTK